MSEPRFVYVTYIATNPETLWRALTQSAFTERYWFGSRVVCDWSPGARVTFWRNDAVSDSGEVLEYEPYRRLSYSWHVEFHAEFRRERPSRVGHHPHTQARQPLCASCRQCRVQMAKSADVNMGCTTGATLT